MAQSQEIGLRAQVLDVVPPGPIHRNRRSIVAKFAHRLPGFREPGASFTIAPDPRAAAAVDSAARKKDDTVSRLRASAQAAAAAAAGASTEIKVPLLLEQRDASSPPGGGGRPGAPSAVYKGVPEAGGGANVEGPPLHYVLFRSGNRVTAFPADQWFSFKPHVDRRGLVDSVAAAAAAARPPAIIGRGAPAAPADPFAMRLVPKSQRLEKQRQEEEARERQEQVAAGRMLPVAADDMGGGAGGGGRLRHYVDEDDLEAELFGDDEEDEAPRGGFGKGGAKGGKKGRGRGKTADGEDLELADDEMPEDLYGGPGVEEDLRPEKPEEAEDWEHEFAPDDDDQDQGADDEVYEDDPGMRKKLGIEGDEEDEGEEADEQARKLQKLGDPGDSDEEEEEKKKQEAEAAKQQQQQQQQPQVADGGGEGEEDEEDDEDEEDLDEIDDMDEDVKPPPRPPQPPPRPAAPPPAPRPVPAAAAPAPAPAAASAAAAASPAPAAAPAAAAPTRAPTSGAKRKLGEEPKAPAEAAKRPRTVSPPPGLAPITADEIVALLRSKPEHTMAFKEFTQHFSARTPTTEIRDAWKKLTLSLCKSRKGDKGELFLVLRTEKDRAEEREKAEKAKADREKK